MTEPMPVLYLSHGGGPLPLLGEPGHARLVRFLEWLPTQLPRPRAIVVISAHWEAPVPTLTSSARPPLLYDYYGFPEASYHITYPAPARRNWHGASRICWRNTICRHN